MLSRVVFLLAYCLLRNNICSLSFELWRDLLVPLVLDVLRDLAGIAGLGSESFIVAVRHDVQIEVDVVIDLHLTSFLAVSLEVLREAPRVFSRQAVHHVLHLVVSFLLSSLNHVLVNLDEIDDSVILVDSRRLIWGKSYFAVYYEVIVVLSFFHILDNELLNQKIP